MSLISLFRPVSLYFTHLPFYFYTLTLLLLQIILPPPSLGKKFFKTQNPQNRAPHATHGPLKQQIGSKTNHAVIRETEKALSQMFTSRKTPTKYPQANLSLSFKNLRKLVPTEGVSVLIYAIGICV